MTERRAYSLADISEKLFNRPLAVTRAKAEIALGVVGPRLNVSQLVVAGEGGAPVPVAALSARAAQALGEIDTLPGDGNLERRSWETGELLDPYEIWNGAAVLKIRGSLMAENGLNPASGATGYDGLSYKLRYARADNRVKGLILDVDTPGGEVVDLMEFCAQLREAGQQMPIRAIVRGMAASAGCAIISCAHEVTAADYSLVGSVGCIMMHADFSKNLEQDGIDVTLITSAAHKADYNPFEPLPKEVLDWAKGMVDASAATFIQHVADTRKLSVDEVVAQEARCFTGPDALAAGLIDKIMPWDASLKEFAEGLNRRQPPSSASARGVISASQTKGTRMELENQDPAANRQSEITQANVDAARAEGVTAGTTAERGRITALAELDGESRISASMSAAIAAGTSAGDYAIALARDAKATTAAALEAAKTDAVDPTNLPGKGPAEGANGGKINRGKAVVDRMRGKHAGLPAQA